MYSNNPIMRAIYAHDFKKFKALVSEPGPDLDTPDESGVNPLALAAFYPSIGGKYLNLLLKYGADINLEIIGTYPIYILIYQSNYDVGAKSKLAELLQYKPKMNLPTKQYSSPLSCAIYSQTSSDIVKMLIDAGADVNEITQTGESILQEAAYFGNIDTIEVLLENGANIDALNSNLVSAADVMLFTAKGKHYDRAMALVNKYSNDTVYKYIGQNKSPKLIDDFASFPINKTYIAMPTAGEIWSVNWFPIARSIMKKLDNVKIHAFSDVWIEEATAKKFNGFILQGAYDNFPKDKDFTIRDLKNETMIDSEKLYQKVLWIADKYKIPTLGVCSGNQHIALYHGGVLTSVNGYGSGHTGRFVEGSIPYFMALNFTEQDLAMNYGIMPPINIPIITSHNYSVAERDLGELKIGVYSEEGVVQSVYKGMQFIGLQFHPEDMYMNSTQDEAVLRSQNIINNFIKIAEKHHNYSSSVVEYAAAMSLMQQDNQAIIDALSLSSALHGGCHNTACLETSLA